MTATVPATATAPRPGGRVSSAVGVAAASLVVAVAAFALAPLGAKALYLAAGLAALAVVGFLLRADLGPPLAEAVDRIRPSRRRSARTVTHHRLRVAGSLAIGVAAGLLGWVGATKGLLALAGAGGLVVAAAVVWLAWPLLVDLVRTPPTDVAPRRRAARAIPQAARPSVAAARTVGCGLVVGVLAWAAAQLGLKGVLVVTGALSVAVLMVVVRDRSVFFTFAGMASLVLVLHKSLSHQDLTQSGGAISIYLTTFDLVICVLYGIWIAEGTFVSDVRAHLARPSVLWVPLVGVLLLLPSLLTAPSVEHSAAELFRMGWMYLLFLYVAVRVRTRRHVWALLAGLAVFAFVELVVVVLQWKTGGVLGLSFLGVPSSLGERTTDTSEIGRPFGTIIHPVFMGAVLGSLGLIALALGLELQRSLRKLAALAMVGVCWIPLYLAQTRASAVAVLAAAIGIVAAALVRGRLAPRTVGRFGIVALVGVAAMLPELDRKFSANFGTGHFFEEIRSRLELNDIAFEMIEGHWGLGVGLNNFELVMPAYEPHPVIFLNNPVHNLYLLYFAETGILGFAGVVAVGLALYRVALRLGRSTDRLFGGLGVGIAGAMGFLMLEELLGFSLRQDIPLAVYWIISGLAVSCYRMAGMAGVRRPVRATRYPAPAARPPRRARVVAPAVNDNRPAWKSSWAGWIGRFGRIRTARLSIMPRTLPRWLRWVSGPFVLVLLLAVLPMVLPRSAAGAQPGSPLVFTAVDRTTGVQGIYTAHADGTDITRITPADGHVYEWPRWALGNSRIVFAQRSGPPGSPEDLSIMDPDGSHRRVLAHFDYRIAQPSIDPTGRWLVFTATPPWFGEVAVFRMDLATLQSVNLTAVTQPGGGFDSDPAVTRDGSHVVLAASTGTHTAIDIMAADGTDRRAITHDSWFNTDPAPSPDGRQVAIASYRGPGNPSGSTDGGHFVDVRPKDWHLVVATVGSGAEKVLTAGADCTVRSPQDPCTVEDMSAFLPRYGPGGDLYFTGALDSTRTCVCAIRPDGTGARTVLASAELAIDWYDWASPGVRAVTDAPVGSAVPASRVLMVVSAHTGHSQLVSATPDLMHRTVLTLPAGLHPEQARWLPDRRSVVFVAKVAVPAHPRAPHPAAPAGRQRRDHVTLGQFSHTLSAGVRPLPRAAAAEQVFLRRPDGTVRQLTDPWTEDWRDGVAPGDARSNSDPTVAPDGRSIVVQNTSTLTGESFLLQIDLATGSVLNLTNGTAGAVPTDDAAPAYSPDGHTIAFTWTDGTAAGLHLMNASDGRGVRAVASALSGVASAAWLPTGRGLVTSVAGAGGSLLVRTGTTASSAGSALAATPFAWQPVVSPTGSSVLFLAPAATGVSIWTQNLSGPSSPRLLQADPVHVVHYLDWR